MTDTLDRAALVKAVAKRIAKTSRGPGYSPLGFHLLPSEVKAAAEAAVAELEPRLK